MIAGKRINLSPDDDTREKLIRLAIACRKHPTTLAMELVKICVNNPGVIDYVQQRFGADARYKVTYRVEKGSLVYD